jgi:hypothetical protein
MDASEAENLFVGVGFLKPDAAWLAKVSWTVCAAMGVAAGVAIASAGVGSAKVPMQEAPTGQD